MGANSSIVKHLDQDYSEIKKKMIANQEKFEDDKFHPSNQVLASSHNSRSDIKWLRPRDICSRNGCPPPKMVVDGTNRFDINQGAIGNCWFQGMFFIVFLVLKIAPCSRNFQM